MTIRRRALLALGALALMARPSQAALFVRGAGTSPVPVNTVAPVISGSPTLFSLLFCDGGTWQNIQSVAFQWMSSNTASPVGSFVDIPGETSSFITITDAGLVGKYLLCRVQGINGALSAYAYSNALGPVT